MFIKETSPNKKDRDDMNQRAVFERTLKILVQEEESQGGLVCGANSLNFAMLKFHFCYKMRYEMVSLVGPLNIDILWLQ